VGKVRLDLFGYCNDPGFYLFPGGAVVGCLAGKAFRRKARAISSFPERWGASIDLLSLAKSWTCMKASSYLSNGVILYEHKCYIHSQIC